MLEAVNLACMTHGKINDNPNSLLSVLLTMNTGSNHFAFGAKYEDNNRQ